MCTLISCSRHKSGLTTVFDITSNLRANVNYGFQNSIQLLRNAKLLRFAKCHATDMKMLIKFYSEKITQD